MIALMILIYLAAVGLVLYLAIILDKQLSTSIEVGWLVMQIGTAVGGAVAWLLRPAVPLIGQLPLGALSATDTMLQPYIDTTINYILAGSIVGAVCGATIGCLSGYLTNRA